LLEGINDSQAQARALTQLLKGLHCNINLIPYNPIGPCSPYQRPPRERIQAFYEALLLGPHKVTIRLERGADIAAACGQLQNQSQIQV
jgi:23S rRNA (adenine2503-C2)-methyltransferase